MLLHVCCGPCSTHVAKFFSKNHEVVGYFYNPNIFPYREWLLRYEAFLKVAKSGFLKDYFPKNILGEEEYQSEHEKFLKAVKGFESEPEGGARCSICFKLRLEEAARFAKEFGENVFAATLTVGRNKKAEVINPIGKECAKKYGLEFYEADFKKQDGFLESVKLSKEFGLYRQHYCGCEFSLRL
jgi:predicted adenine nucleotide alpha hydrolase (AANH) superfamily ATPase